MSKIFFFDVDGTLLDHNNGLHSISTNTKVALEALSKNNILIIASGRSKCMLDKELLSLPVDGYLLANGAYCELGKQVLFSHTVAFDVLNKIRAYCENKDLVYYFENATKIFTGSINHPLHLAFNKAWGVNYDNSVYSCDKFNDKSLINTGMLVCHNIEETNEVFNDLKEIVDLRRHNNYPSFDFLPFGINKGSGVKEIMHHYNLDSVDAYAFGDGFNDIEMLKAVTNSVAMGNACSSLKEIAREVTCSVSEDGIYKYLLAHKLI